MVSFNPSIPKGWDGYSFKLCIGEKLLSVKISGQDATFELLCGDELKLKVYDEELSLTDGPISVKTA
jgi:maltose phosphorylase